jgi:hypothetical protein
MLRTSVFVFWGELSSLGNKKNPVKKSKSPDFEELFF